MTSDTLVSVVVASYNHEGFVRDALVSLLAQTHAALELIVLDDGSTDRTFSCVRELLPELQRRFVRAEVLTKPNEGAARTISRGLDWARSDHVFLLDSDDVALPTAIADLLPYLEEPGVALAVGDNEYIDADGNTAGLVRDGQLFSTLLAFHTLWRREFSATRDFGSYASLIGGNYVPNGWLLRRGCVADVGGYTPDAVLDDWSLLVRLAKRYRIAYAGYVLAKYRLHSGNRSRVDADRLLLDTVRILLHEREYCSAHDLEREWFEHARALTREHVQGAAADQDPNLGPELKALVKAVNAEEAKSRNRGVAQAGEVAWPRAKRRIAPPPESSEGQRIHVYALCRDDARMLPFFFRHYDPIVQQYVIFDDGSTDGSLDLLHAHPRVEVRRFSWAHPDSFVLSELAHYDSCWKESRGLADWVVVADLDEHLFHRNLATYLKECLEQGVTAIPALGYEMISDRFPGPDEHLSETRTVGIPSVEMSKMGLFSPAAVEETRFSPGGHRAAPVGRIVVPPRDELLLLHYKLLGVRYAAERQMALRRRLGPADLAERWGDHWAASEAELSALVERDRAQQVDLSLEERDSRDRSTSVWWSSFPRAADLAGQLAEMTQRWQAASRRNAAIAKDLVDCSAERVRVVDEWQAATRRNASMTKDLIDCAADRVRVVDEWQAATRRVEALEASRTWRWSAPLRRAIDAALRVRRTLRRPRPGR